MVVADWHALVSPMLAATVLAVAALLSIRQWVERQGRAEVLSEADRRHFARQDIRRFTGVTIMALIGLGMIWGARIDPKGDGRSQRLYLCVWLGVILLVLFLVLLALLDLLATRLYARRHRRVLADERREALKVEFSRPDGPRHGRDGPNGEVPPGASLPGG